MMNIKISLLDMTSTYKKFHKHVDLEMIFE